METSLLIEFIRECYKTSKFIPLHAPIFSGNERTYVMETLDSTFVSSVGKFVNEFERKVKEFTGSAYAVATVNGTAALHSALYMAQVKPGDFVITQALTFVATCNSIYHLGAEPIFVDISPVSLGLCPRAVERYLEENAELDETGCIHRQTGRRIKAIVPMHTFGHPVELDELAAICFKWKLTLVEDAAESLGSFYKGRHTGTIGALGAISFNGNKIITTGGGGIVLCNSEDLGKRLKHLTTTAKIPHPYEFFHDEAGFNYRMPNINAALGCAQIEMLNEFLLKKRKLAQIYKDFFSLSDVEFVTEPEYAHSNYWLNSIICVDQQQRNEIIEQTNNSGVMTRPVWKLMHRLPMFKNSLCGELTYSEFIEARLVNLPSTPII
ncbi:LegC family aminotransferase [Escherichia albertii]|uniref:GDP-perosamine synthase n=1 Tax=Escherichia albertii TaxID=208962 RepID=A0A5A4U7T1_ESCAL|nr:LegC family aminotransferase [Escherichia albertii]EHW5313303.1 LegC family aminotransferase [Escherichia albertii]MCZ8963966.1 LegC family aminotransferase [Escherichia albertii]MCZ9017281.1 LegC family aminotransferase [Escherichia albertii]MCZ9135505.1 LegC family aminotransferase [Escherichia albertii]QTA21470.1 LegC family aminotransferase [Escherichia albertii]